MNYGSPESRSGSINTFVLNHSMAKSAGDYRPCANLKLQYMYLIIFSKPVSIIQWRHYITFHSHVLMTSASQHHKKKQIWTSPFPHCPVFTFGRVWCEPSHRPISVSYPPLISGGGGGGSPSGNPALFTPESEISPCWQSRGVREPRRMDRIEGTRRLNGA